MAQKQSQNDVDLSGQTVWVIDLFSRVYQLFHALPEMSSPEGTPVSVIFGLTRDLIDITEKKKPNYILGRLVHRLGVWEKRATITTRLG